jgi:hypothetical protein
MMPAIGRPIVKNWSHGRMIASSKRIRMSCCLAPQIKPRSALVNDAGHDDG